ncbi:2-hydroxyacyl-CoA dehydratase, partial [uncultured Bacteroides sp.]|uniref:2-hydroxyacyl-CoA dehydratase n=1 Tax=uncultured Bacteroides sp. TaxID=162156 RepID=UPI002627B269
RNTCPLIKSFAGFKLGEVCPYIESSDLVVGENTCDGKKKAYEFFATQKNMYVMDIPNVHDESTLVTWKAEVKKLAAKMLGIGRSTLYNKLDEYGLNEEN